MGSSHAKENCQDLLENNLYRCNMTIETGVQYEFCLQAVSPGVESEKFDVVIFGSESLGCTCKAKGKVDKPTFDTSKAHLRATISISKKEEHNQTLVELGTPPERPLGAVYGRLRGAYRLP
jgi:hypothetical protein